MVLDSLRVWPGSRATLISLSLRCCSAINVTTATESDTLCHILAMRTLQQLRLYLMLTRRALAQPEIQLHCLAPLLMNLYESAFASSKFGSTNALRRYILLIASRMGLPIDILLICFKIVQLAFSLCASFYIIVPFIKFTWYYNRTQQIQRGFFLRRIGKHCRLILSASLAYAVIVILDDPGLPEEHRLPDLPIMKYLACLLMIALLLDTFVVWPVISLIMRRHPDNAKYMFHDVRLPIMPTPYAHSQTLHRLQPTL